MQLLSNRDSNQCSTKWAWFVVLGCHRLCAVASHDREVLRRSQAPLQADAAQE